MAERHLRLDEITKVMPGEQITICDVLNVEALPIIVRKKTGSDASIVGTHLGFGKWKKIVITHYLALPISFLKWFK